MKTLTLGLLIFLFLTPSAFTQTYQQRVQEFEQLTVESERLRRQTETLVAEQKSLEKEADSLGREYGRLSQEGDRLETGQKAWKAFADIKTGEAKARTAAANADKEAFRKAWFGVIETYSDMVASLATSPLPSPAWMTALDGFQNIKTTVDFFQNFDQAWAAAKRDFERPASFGSEAKKAIADARFALDLVAQLEKRLQDNINTRKAILQKAGALLQKQMKNRDEQKAILDRRQQVQAAQEANTAARRAEVLRDSAPGASTRSGEPRGGSEPSDRPRRDPEPRAQPEPRGRAAEPKSPEPKGTAEPKGPTLRQG